MSSSVLETQKPATISLRELHEQLQNAGVDVGYSTLSALIAEGDIAQQLQAGGDGRRREFPADVAMVLREFLPRFQEIGGKKAHAPEALRRFLASSSTVSETVELTQVAPVDISFPVPRTAELATLTNAVTDLVVYLRSSNSITTARPPQDRLLDSHAVAEVLACKPAAIRRYVRPVLLRPSRWRESDVLFFIAELGQGRTGTKC